MSEAEPKAKSAPRKKSTNKAAKKTTAKNRAKPAAKKEPAVGVKADPLAAKAEMEQPTPAEVVGTVAWLMMQDPTHKHAFLADLEWMVIPPVMNRQFRLFREGKTPVGYAAWARVSDEVNDRLKDGNHKLRPADWTSGEHLWLVDFVAPFGGGENMLKVIKEQVFKGEKVVNLEFRA